MIAKRRSLRLGGVVVLAVAIGCAGASAQELFEVPEGVTTRWYSFENPEGRAEGGGRANAGRKGAAWRRLGPGESVTLADVPGPGVVRRIWLTFRQTPELRRGLVIRMWWEDQARPSVEAPIQDFLGIPFARAVAFESALFSNPEARSFNCFVPMPFRKHARIAIANESPMETPLYYDVNVTLGDRLPGDLAYFHAAWRRENPTGPKRDFEILPRVEGRGRFLGTSVGVRPVGNHRQPAWFGEGELKVYLDDDRVLPTLVGTGTEDLVGSAWGLGRFDHLTQGAILTEAEDGVWAFYRLHVADPVYFAKAIRVTLQQMAGAPVEWLKSLPETSRPVLVASGKRFRPEEWPNDAEWQNFELAQDVCATAYWYQTLPSPALPPLPSYEERMQDLALPPADR